MNTRGTRIEKKKEGLLIFSDFSFSLSEGYSCPVAYNPADFLIATLATAPRDEDASRRNAQRICDAFLVSDACKEVDLILQLELHIASSYSVSQCSQFFSALIPKRKLIVRFSLLIFFLHCSGEEMRRTPANCKF